MNGNIIAYGLIVLATACFAAQNMMYEQLQMQKTQVSPSIILMADFSVLLMGCIWYWCQPQSIGSLHPSQWKLLLTVSVLLAAGMILLIGGYKVGARAQTATLLLMLIPAWIPLMKRVSGIVLELNRIQIAAFILGMFTVCLAIYGDSLVDRKAPQTQTSKPR